MRSINMKLGFVAIVVAFLGSCNQEDAIQLRDSEVIVGKEVKSFDKVPKAARVEGRYLQEIEMTADPTTGLVPKGRFDLPRKILRQAQENLANSRNPIANVDWQERGPRNVSGRTRAVMFDPNDVTNKKIWAGSVGGGLWYCNDITATDITWSKVDDFWDNLAISSLAYDPSDTQVMYAGTGEAYGNADAISGDGIWKSTDGGATWLKLSNTTSFSNITEMEVLANGTILAGTRSRLRRSTNGGSSWTIATQEDIASLSVNNNGDIYAGNFAGDILKSTDNGATWSTVLTTDASRVEVATSPNTFATTYAIGYKYNAANRNQDISWIKKTTNGGTTWSDLNIPGYPGCSPNPATHFTRSQGWYDLTMIVHPSDPNKIVVGGVDCHASADGGITWAGISNWYNCSGVDYVHADIHHFITRPGQDNSLVVGCDGGVFYSENIYPSSGNADFKPIIDDYNVTQFYHGDIHPAAGEDYILAGAQDNGTQRMDNPGIDDADEVTGGDGAYTHIDQDEPNIQISAYVYNNYYVSTTGFSGGTQSVNIGNSLGQFINPTDYDSQMNVLYGSAGSNQYSFVKNIGGLTLSSGTTSISGLAGRADGVKVSPNVTDRIYLGNGDKIVRVDNAQSAAPTATLLSLVTGISTSAYVSSIEIEYGNEDHILVTYSNFNSQSIMQSLDGGSTWAAVDGNLPNIPVRSIVLDPNNSDQAIIATELGVWTTDDLDGSSTDWDPTNTGLANVRTDMVRYRQSDNEMMAATHGRGVFTSSSFDCGDVDGCYPALCRIGDVSIDDLTCDSGTNTYTATLSISVFNSPASGMLDVNGVQYPILFDEAAQVVVVDLDGTADGSSVDLSIRLTATDCEVFRPRVFIAPSSGCGDGLTCTFATTLSGSGTYNVPSIASGNGCFTCNSAEHAFWYEFTPNCSGTISVASCDEGTDTNFYIYSGASCTSLVTVAASDDDCSMGPGLDDWASEVIDITVVEGLTYYIEWDNKWSPSGFDWVFDFVSDDVLFVDAAAVGSGSGCSWANAITDLNTAIAIVDADPNLNQLWLKSGIYKPGSQQQSTFLLSNDIQLYGGFAGVETEVSQRNILANPTILSGEIGDLSSTNDNCYNVVSINENNETAAVIDGITIEDGNANNPQWPKNGGGIMSFGNSEIKNTIIRNCQSSETGAAIYHVGFGASMLLENVTLINNTTADQSENVYVGENAQLQVKGVVIVD